MKKHSRFFSAFALFCCASFASASPIFYTATDIVDDVLGEDLWRYDYHVANTTGLQIDSFAIFFDSPHYELRTVATGFGDEVLASDYSAPSGWEGLALPFDEFLGEEAQFVINLADFSPVDAIASDSPVPGFSVNFVWNGSGSPGSQLFNYFDFNDFDFVGEAFTQRLRTGGGEPVPAPATVWLMVLGLAVIIGRRTQGRR